MVSPQLLPQRRRQLPQLVAGAAQVHGDARLEHVAQLDEEDALLVTAQRTSAMSAGVGNSVGLLSPLSPRKRAASYDKIILDSSPPERAVLGVGQGK
eukprot:scaffold89951_cov48-Phaeocystis_antarctica.AAC.4